MREKTTVEDNIGDYKPKPTGGISVSVGFNIGSILKGQILSNLVEEYLRRKYRREVAQEEIELFIETMSDAQKENLPENIRVLPTYSPKSE